MDGGCEGNTWRRSCGGAFVIIVCDCGALEGDIRGYLGGEGGEGSRKGRHGGRSGEGSNGGWVEYKHFQHRGADSLPDLDIRTCANPPGVTIPPIYWPRRNRGRRFHVV